MTDCPYQVKGMPFPCRHEAGHDGDHQPSPHSWQGAETATGLEWERREGEADRG